MIMMINNQLLSNSPPLISSLSILLHLLLLLQLATQSVSGRILVLNTNESYYDRLAAFGPRIVNEKPPFIEGILIPVEALSIRPRLGRTNDPTLASPTLASSFNNDIDDNDIDDIDDNNNNHNNNNNNHPQPQQSSPQQGCMPVYPPFGIPKNTSWIAIVERGYCAFVDKVRLMQEAGAAAVIVGDSEKNAGLITMFASGDTSDVHIPAVFIAQWEYRDLRSQSRDGNLRRWKWREAGVADYINELEPLMVRLLPSEEWQWPLMDIIVITIISPSVLLLLLYCLWRYRRHQREQQQQHSIMHGLNGDTGDAGSNLLLNADELRRLPLLVYDDDSRPLAEEPDVCVVCLEWIVEGQQVRVLPHCGHLFHSECIDPWLTTRKRYCPICKRDALPATINTGGTSAAAAAAADERTPLLPSSAPPHVAIDIPPAAVAAGDGDSVALERLSASFRSHGSPQVVQVQQVESSLPVAVVLATTTTADENNANLVDALTTATPSDNSNQQQAPVNRQPSVRRWRAFRPRRANRTAAPAQQQQQQQSYAAISTPLGTRQQQQESPSTGLMRLFGSNSRHSNPS